MAEPASPELQRWARDHPAIMGFALSGASVSTGVVLTNWVGAWVRTGPGGGAGLVTGLA